MAYAYQAALTVPAPTGSHTNFTLCLIGTDLKMATVANGGQVVNTVTRVGQTVPADLVLSSDTAATLLYSWGWDYYNPVTGQVVMWVKIPSYTAGMTIYVSVGNAAVATYQGGAQGAEFDSNAVSSWRLADGTTLNLKDFTSRANDGTASNSPVAVAGKIDGGLSVVPANSQVAKASATGLPTATTAQFTISGWHKTAALVDLAVYFGFGRTLPSSLPDGNCRYLMIQSSHYYFWASSADWDTGVTFDADGLWHHWAFVFDGTNLIFYRDGISAASRVGMPSGLITADTTITAGSHHPVGANANAFQDQLDIAATGRSANWMATVYANQNNPPSIGAFTSLGAVRLLASTGVGR